MGNDDQRLAPVQSVDGIHDRRLRLIVKCRSRLIQHQHLRVFKKRPGNADTLPLPAGDPDAPLADARIKPLRQSPDELIQLRFPQRLPDLIVVNLLVRTAERHVPADRGIDHKDALRDIADIFEPGSIMLSHLHAVRQNPARLQLQKPQQNIHDGSLARTGSSHNTHRFADRNLHYRMVEDQRLRIGILIGDILQHDLFPDRQLLHLFLPQISLHAVIHVFIPYLFLQIIADTHKERLEIGNRRQMVVDPVGTGNQPHGRHSKKPQLRDDIRCRRSLQKLYHQIQDHTRDGKRLDQQPRRGIIQVIALHRTHITGAALGIFVDKIAFPAGNLDFLDPHHRLVDPLIKPAVEILILLTGPAHDRF